MDTSSLHIYSIDTLLYPYALPILQFPYSFSSLCLSCNLSSSLRSLQSANCSLVLSLWQGFDYEWVAELDLLEVKLVAEVSSQLEFLSVGTILGSGTGEIIWAGWIV